MRGEGAGDGQSRGEYRAVPVAASRWNEYGLDHRLSRAWSEWLLAHLKHEQSALIEINDAPSGEYKEQPDGEIPVSR